MGAQPVYEPHPGSVAGYDCGAVDGAACEGCIAGSEEAE